MENSSDDIILPEVDTEPHTEPALPQPAQKPRLLAILTAVAFLVLVGALVFVIINNNNQPVSNEPVATEPFYYDNNDFNEQMNEAELRMSEGDYFAARDIIKKNALIERMTASQKYRYYSILVALYDESALNDPAERAQYEALAAQTLAEIRKGE